MSTEYCHQPHKEARKNKFTDLQVTDMDVYTSDSTSCQPACTNTSTHRSITPPKYENL